MIIKILLVLVGFAQIIFGADVLVTSWVYFGKPQDIKMSFSRG